MKLLVDVQNASREQVPSSGALRQWIAAALAGRTTQGAVEISVRLVDAEEMARLNARYRGKDGATNVLSFPADLPPNLDLPLLGDIVICAPVVLAEAAQQGKSASAHWAHMTIHGTLHLLGYDHIKEEEAEIMEALESAILRQFDYGCPYRNQPRQEERASL